MAKSEVVKAMEVLFGEDFNCKEGTLRYIQPSGIKKAFRHKAMISHPDHANRHIDKVVDFQVLQDAYNLLMSMKLQECPMKHRSRPRAGQKSSRDAVYKKKPQSPESRGDFYYRSKMLPDLPLRIGEFLYYSGDISWRILIDAIVEQRKGGSRLFGEYFIRKGILNRMELRKALLSLRQHNQKVKKSVS